MIVIKLYGCSGFLDYLFVRLVMEKSSHGDPTASLPLQAGAPTSCLSILVSRCLAICSALFRFERARCNASDMSSFSSPTPESVVAAKNQ